MTLSPGDRLEVTVESLAHGGKGVARHEGQVLFVALAAPGDRALVRVAVAHKRYAEAEIERMVEPSPWRRDPRCPVFGSCGGCQWLHLSPAAQARAKQEALLALLERIGKVVPERLDPILAPGPGEDLGYRSRAVLRARAEAGKARFGFFAEGGRELVQVPGTCLVLAPELDEAVRELGSRRWPRGPFKAELALVGDGRVHVTLRVMGHGGEYDRALAGFPHRVLDERGRVLADSEPSLKLLYEVEAAGRRLALSVRPGDFSQVHRGMNRVMIGRALGYAAPASGERVYDLYAGAGNLAIPLACVAGHVVGIERSLGSVEDARANAAANGLSNVEFHAGEVKRVLERLREREAPPPGIVVLDPPRSGAAEALDAIVRLGARRLVYVSCDPATLARDLGRLVPAGYRLLRAGAVDMFPQTFHVEAVALLELE